MSVGGGGGGGGGQSGVGGGLFGGGGFSINPVASTTQGPGSQGVFGAGQRVFSGGGGDLFQGANQVLGQTLATGNAGDTGNLRNILQEQFGQAFKGRASNLKEELGGLGLRFSSDLTRQLTDAATTTLRDQEAAITQAEFGNQQQAAQRQLQGLQLVLNAPSQFQQLSQAGLQAARQPLTDALSFATSHAPVGQSSSSKGFNVGL